MTRVHFTPFIRLWNKWAQVLKPMQGEPSVWRREMRTTTHAHGDTLEPAKLSSSFSLIMQLINLWIIIPGLLHCIIKFSLSWFSGYFWLFCIISCSLHSLCKMFPKAVILLAPSELCVCSFESASAFFLCEYCCCSVARVT